MDTTSQLLGTRPMMTITGTLGDSSPLVGSVLIIAELIPSWLLAVGAQICPTSGIFVCIEDELTWFRRTCVKHFGIACSDIGMSELETHPSFSGATRIIVLLQGSAPFVLKTCKLLSEINVTIWKLVAVASGRVVRHAFPWKLDWNRYSHAQLGGVTTSRVEIGHLNTGHYPSHDKIIQRTLKGILKFDLGGKSHSAPRSETAHLDVQIPPGKLLATWVVPSAYSKTGWVERRLDNVEIGRALDVPPGMLPSFSIGWNLHPELYHRLLRLPPLKSIQFGAQLLVENNLIESSASKAIVQEHPHLAIGLPAETVLQEEVTGAYAQAVKGDDVPTDSALWDKNVLSLPTEGDCSSWIIVGLPYCEAHQVIFTFLRDSMLRRFQLNASDSFRKYLHATRTSAQDSIADSQAGRDALQRARGTTFWDWTDGSSIFFWRWQPEVKRDTRDGTSLWVKGTLPAFRQPQRKPKDDLVAEQVSLKIQKVVRRRYLEKGMVKSLTNYFAVPKGEHDIRLVYNMTSSGLNDALWAPSFWLPVVEDVLECACHSSWFGDIDAGDQFLNYPLDPKIRPYAGVDVSWMHARLLWLRWTRMAMGLVPSPFVAVRLFSWAFEIIKGNREDPSNPFHWSKVILNLPGMPSFDESMPRVYKWNPITAAIAADVKTYVDDSRTVGPTEATLRSATHRVETCMAYLGLQDATRKRRPESQRPGEWTGSITVASPGIGLFVTVSAKKWTKTQGHLSWVLEHFSCSTDRPTLLLKELEKRVGFLVHLAMAYPLIFPFLKGFYLTMNSWRPGRFRDGWKMPAGCYASFLANTRRSDDPRSDPSSAFSPTDDAMAPQKVTAAAILFEHATTLASFFSAPSPALRLIRGSSALEVCYFYGDASGDGFGASWWTPSNGTISFRYGIWGQEGLGTSSNYRELRNLVESLEAMAIKGGLEGKSIFVFTDNSVSESIAAKGSSVSKPLYELVVRLFKLEMSFRCKVLFIHVAGSRMIHQGTDGLSRGDMWEGVMRGESMLSHVPLHESSIERSSAILLWIESWATHDNLSIEVLQPEGWFERGHDICGSSQNIDGMWIPRYKPAMFIWAPPPAAARTALVELRQARHKRQQSLHIFVCPRLMWQEWRRHLFKSADLIFHLPEGNSIWPEGHHEPLIFGIFFPYLHRNPWELRKSELMVVVERALHKLLKKDIRAGGDLLSQLCLLTQRMDAMSFRQLRRVLRGQEGITLPRE